MIMKNSDSVFKLNTPYQSIIAVANPDEKSEIKKRLNGELTNVAPFWFC